MGICDGFGIRDSPYEKNGLEEHIVAADGNCFFHATSVLLGMQPDMHIKLRQQTVEYMIKWNIGDSLQHEAMKNPGEWATDQAIMGMSRYI